VDGGLRPPAWIESGPVNDQPNQTYRWSFSGLLSIHAARSASTTMVTLFSA
jgi:hypothetical protein